MKKYQFEIISISKNILEIIILINIYIFVIIRIFRNKHIKFIVICKFFLNNVELCNINYAFKFVLQK